MYVITAWMVATALVQESAGTSREAADTMELSRLENVWNDAHLRGDADVLERLWADDFVVTVPKMTVMTKADAIGVWRSGRMKFQQYQTSDLRIRVYDNAAMVTGRLQRTRNPNGRTLEDDWRFTKVYLRRGGQWRVVAFHASELGQ